NNKIFDFNIFFQELGFIQGKCELKWYSKVIDNISFMVYNAGFNIIEIDEIDKKNFREALKRFCFVKNGRDFL
ncbi:MAG: hypothetical protein JXB50_10365, partial [Spirochaetes bacterium]|nr:hypothetical protein [Spirochaetota bacterium]